MAQQDKDYWFPAKRYGYGWGLPRRWQGWVVIVAYIAVLAAAGIIFPPRTYSYPFVGIVLFATVVLIGICWRKGEPTGWHWG